MKVECLCRGELWTVNVLYFALKYILLHNLRNKHKERESSEKWNARRLFCRRMEEGSLLFLCLNRIQEYDLAENMKSC